MRCCSELATIINPFERLLLEGLSSSLAVSKSRDGVSVFKECHVESGVLQHQGGESLT